MFENLLVDVTKEEKEDSVNANAKSIGISELRKIVKEIHEKTEFDKEPVLGNQNCMLCTWCLEAQIRGINILPRGVYNPKDVIFNFEGCEIVKNPEKIKIHNKREVKTLLLKEEGSRFYVHVNWAGSKGGHEFIIMNIANEIYVVDAQRELIATLDSKYGLYYFNGINYENSYLVRIDNKKLNRDIIRYNDDAYILRNEESFFDKIKFIKNKKCQK